MARTRVSQSVTEALLTTSGDTRISALLVEALQADTWYDPIAGATVLSGTGATATSFVTASHTPSNDVLYILSVYATNSISANITPTATHAGGLTWVQVGHQNQGAFSCTVFRALKSSGLSAGTTTIDFGGNTQNICGWSIDSYTNVSLAGTDGSGAIAATGGAAGTTNNFSAGLAAPQYVSNVSALSVGHVVNEAVTVGSGYTALGSGTAAALGFKSEWRIPHSTTVNATWATSAVCAGVSYEIRTKNAVGGFPSAALPGGAVSRHTVEVLVTTDGAARIFADAVEILYTDLTDVEGGGGTTTFGYAT